jgi:hypothetical protein
MLPADKPGTSRWLSERPADIILSSNIIRRKSMNSRFGSFISEIATLETALHNLSKEQIAYRIADNKWNIAEIVAHLVDTEIQVYTRFRSILADDVPYISNHNEAKWTVAFDHASIDVNESLAIFKLMRNLNYKLIESLNDHQLKMRGLHSIRGWMTVADLIEVHIVHLENHIGQINRNLAEFEKTRE